MSNDVDAPEPPGGAPAPDSSDAPDDPPAAPDTDRLRATGRWLRRHARHAMVVGVVTAVVGALATVAADQLPKLFEDPPPPCPGAGCDGKSPKSDGCAADAVTWEPTEGNVARIQLRYSKRCGAVWGRIVNGEPGDMVTISVTDGSSRSASIATYHDVYTRMATVGDTFRVRFCAEPGSYTGHTGNWVKYCFEATEHTEWN
ncbi:DUF2690 domain-containing protein [Streptomyces gilvosporeus]|uniref:DUF2690 domain-containing protein n=1 Tax=Streptomyces gilvosporeus TaxID=553510 RepID=A0A1V0TS89_9ACTN|nr:DUF2690 domain-containing protein [Streptomyces gilvosporeus]ARF55806.1 hypothetical protein B1H19_17905 [Streptomyces gilvosporeus]